MQASIGTRSTARGMNIICPTGGVMPAMVRLVTSTMPNFRITGTKIGVRMIRAAVPSTAVPSTISRALTSRSSSVGSEARPTIQVAMAGGC